MGRWARSRQLASASWQVVKQDKELLVLPLVSGFASLIIGGSFLVPIVMTARHTDAFGQTTFQPGPVSYVLLFAMYIVLAYITIFFRTALLWAADERLRGGDPTLGSAFAGATARAGRILPWAVVSATVSIILRSLQERSGLLGRFVIGLIGMAWAVVTFLVLPIMVFEEVGVGTAVRRSTEMLKRTWGENLIVNTGIGLLSFVLTIPAIVVAVAGMATGTVPGLVVGLVVAAIWSIAVVCWSNAMSGVFQVALYRYAIDGAAPGPFAHVDLGGAFTTKRGRRSFGGGGWTPPVQTPGWPPAGQAPGGPPPEPPRTSPWPDPPGPDPSDPSGHSPG
ncbi:MAG: hypothetical protein JWM05_368 [Acidimicrobiales bacterium]|nr:hypothetical protein [Acidimicrobiales bacterium]